MPADPLVTRPIGWNFQRRSKQESYRIEDACERAEALVDCEEAFVNVGVIFMLGPEIMASIEPALSLADCIEDPSPLFLIHLARYPQGLRRAFRNNLLAQGYRVFRFRG